MSVSRALARAAATISILTLSTQLPICRTGGTPSAVQISFNPGPAMAEMGLIAPPSESEAPRQLESGAAEEAAAEPAVQEAEVEEVSDDEAEQIPEAQLISEFDKLEEKQAES